MEAKNAKIEWTAPTVQFLYVQDTALGGLIPAFDGLEIFDS
jgi:hypothetical protein